MKLLFLHMPNGFGWLFFLAVIYIGIPYLAYRIRYNYGKKSP